MAAGADILVSLCLSESLTNRIETNFCCILSFASKPLLH